MDELEKYRMRTGYYDTAAIRRDEGMSQAKALWLMIFNEHEEGEEQSELLKAALAANAALDARGLAREQAAKAANVDEAKRLLAVIDSATASTDDRQQALAELFARGLARIEDEASGLVYDFRAARELVAKPPVAPPLFGDDHPDDNGPDNSVSCP